MRRIERTHLNWFIASPNAEAPTINTLSGIPKRSFNPLTSMTSDRVINASTMCVHLYSWDSQGYYFSQVLIDQFCSYRRRWTNVMYRSYHAHFHIYWLKSFHGKTFTKVTSYFGFFTGFITVSPHLYQYQAHEFHSQVLHIEHTKRAHFFMHQFFFVNGMLDGGKNVTNAILNSLMMVPEEWCGIIVEFRT